MYEKQPELMAIRDDEKLINLPFFALYEKEAQKMREEKRLEKEFLEKKAPTGKITRSGSNPSNGAKEQKQPLNKQSKIIN